jgi:hypothetical protein
MLIRVKKRRNGCALLDTEIGSGNSGWCAGTHGNTVKHESTTAEKIKLGKSYVLLLAHTLYANLIKHFQPTEQKIAGSNPAMG